MNLSVARVPGGFLEEVVGALQLAHQVQDKVSAVVPRSIIGATTCLM